MDSKEERKKLIDIISGLYPPDSDYRQAAETGRELLLDSLCRNWRILPIEVLRTLSMLNVSKENFETQRILRNG